ncbi:VOC family protein [uncultured Arthrobacter sp.]|uniref:VOC family protein n=1 Tax=uncultured Arthrobacter sp. TaxID=114050 RepID=UPI003216E01E
MKYLHTMVRVTDIDASLRFYRDALGLELISRRDNEAGRFTLLFLAAPGDASAQVELTYNWDPEAYQGGRNFGHLAYAVDDIYAVCQRLKDAAIVRQLDAAAVFERQIDNGHVGLHGGSHLARFGHAARFAADLEIRLRGNQADQPLAQQRMVVNDQNSHGHRSAAFDRGRWFNR